MTFFDDREHAFEERFAHDRELVFKVEARRNKLAGLWAAGLLGLEAEAAQAYAMDVVASDFEEAGIEDVVRKLAGDLKGRADVEAIRAKLAEVEIQARTQIMTEI